MGSDNLTHRTLDHLIEKRFNKRTSGQFAVKSVDEKIIHYRGIPAIGFLSGEPVFHSGALFTHLKLRQETIESMNKIVDLVPCGIAFTAEEFTMAAGHIFPIRANSAISSYLRVFFLEAHGL